MRPEFEQPFGVIHHLRSLTPVFYVATGDPQAVAEELQALLEKNASTQIVEGPLQFTALLWNAAPSRPDNPLFFIDTNPRKWFEAEAWIEVLGALPLVLDAGERRDMRNLIMVGPIDMPAPKHPWLVPRIEAGQREFMNHPPVVVPDVEAVDRVTERVRSLFGRMTAASPLETQQVPDGVVELVLHLTPFEMEQVIAQSVILAKDDGGKSAEFFEKPEHYIKQVFEGRNQYNGWPK